MQETALALVSLAQAKKLKELGFDWEVLEYYEHDNLIHYNDEEINWNDSIRKYEVYSAPSVALALKWFRDVKGVNTSLFRYIRYDGITYNTYSIENVCKLNNEDCNYYSTYEEAESALLDALLEYCEVEKNGNREQQN